MAGQELDRSGVVLIYCAAGKRYGIGHYSRSRLISNTLPRLSGRETELKVIQDSSPNQAEKLDVDTMPSRGVFEEILNDVQRKNASAVILDIPWWDPDFAEPEDRRLFEAVNVPIIGVDGPLDQNTGFDLVFLPSFLGPDALKDSSAPLRFGWDCLLLPNRAMSPRKHLGDSVVVFTGGSDAKELGQVWPSLLDLHLEPGTDVTWIQGPLAPEPVLPENPRVHFRVVQNPSNVSQLIESAGYGLSVHGVSLFEILASGVPAVSYSPYGAKDTRELQVLGALGLAKVGSSPEDAAIKLRKLMGDPFRAQAQGQLAQRTIGTPGEETFATELQKLRLKMR